MKKLLLLISFIVSAGQVNAQCPITISGNNTAICSSQCLTFTASGATTYTWLPSGTNTSSITVCPSSSTIYTVTGSTGSCTSTQTISVTVNPTPTVNPIPNIQYCPNTIIPSINFSASPNGPTSFFWTNSDPSIGLSASSGVGNIPSFYSTNASSSPITSTISVTATLNGCVGPDYYFTITIQPNPIVSVNSATICAGDSTILTASGAVSYSWWPWTGLSASNAASVTANPDTTTTYAIIGISAFGCKDTTTSTVTVNSCTGVNQYSNNNKTLIYPNPTSDQFLLEANSTDNLTVDLYDVNGRHVFNTSVMDKSNINVTTLENGIYTLTIKTVGRTINKKLVIVH